MSIDQGSISVTKRRRTNEMRLTAPLGPTSAYSVVINREEVRTDADNNLVSQQPVSEIRRTLADIATDSVTISINGTPTAIAAAELMAGIVAFADKWDQEEIDAAAQA